MKQHRRSTALSLDQLKIASPCDANWDGMAGDDRVRHCRQCGLNVYNIAQLTRSEAESLIREHSASGQRLCARLYRRADGTVITRDCPVGLAALKARARRGWQRAAASIALLMATGTLFGVVNSRSQRNAQGLDELEPFKMVKSVINPAPPPPVAIPMGRCVMGDIAMPAPNQVALVNPAS